MIYFSPVNEGTLLITAGAVRRVGGETPGSPASFRRSEEPPCRGRFRLLNYRGRNEELFVLNVFLYTCYQIIFEMFATDLYEYKYEYIHSSICLIRMYFPTRHKKGKLFTKMRF